MGTLKWVETRAITKYVYGKPKFEQRAKFIRQSGKKTTPATTDDDDHDDEDTDDDDDGDSQASQYTMRSRLVQITCCHPKTHSHSLAHIAAVIRAIFSQNPSSDRRLHIRTHIAELIVTK